jgi:hypothetical protein
LAYRFDFNNKQRIKIMSELLSFHNSQAIKDKYVARVKAHQEADNIIQGQGWYEGKGCAVGCTLENYAHSQYPVELGLPEWLAHLQDAIFEGLPRAEAKAFPLQFLEAIPVGVDLEPVYHQLAILRLSTLLVDLDDNHVQAKDITNQVIEYHRAALKGALSNEELEGLRAAAEATAEAASRSDTGYVTSYATEAAAGAAARSAEATAEAASRSAEATAEAAAGAAARSARAAAAVVTWAAAGAHAWSAAWKTERDNLLVTLRGLK